MYKFVVLMDLSFTLLLRSEILLALHKLEQLLQKLQASKKALSTFLEDKRNAFDRFFFLRDDDLLEILGRPDSVI